LEEILTEVKPPYEMLVLALQFSKGAAATTTSIEVLVGGAGRGPGTRGELDRSCRGDEEIARIPQNRREERAAG
jgi:hypothetical protein